MWTSTLDLNPRRVMATRLLGLVWPGVRFSAIAPLRVENLPRQSLPLASWVRVRNRLSGINAADLRLISARSDAHIASAAIPRRAAYVGQEAVGEVIEIGDEVKRLGVGDRVALQYNPNCISTGVEPPCRSCACGNYDLCEYGPLPGPQPSAGGWGEEMLVHEQQLFRIPAALSDEQAVMLKPAAAAIHAVLRRLPQLNDRVLIIGAGTVGLLTLQTLRALAPQAEISVLARYSFQVEQATRMGATHIIYPQDSYIGIQRATQARLYHGPLGNRALLGGYDLIYDTVGQAKTLHHALRWARARATVVLVGQDPHFMHIDLTPVWSREINLLGACGQGMETWAIGTEERQSTFSVAAEMMAAGQIHPERLITHHFSLPDYRNALMTAAHKEDSRATKVVFDFSLLPASVVPAVRASAARPHRPAVVGAQRATRPLGRGSAPYVEPADLPVTPLPAFEPEPLIPAQPDAEDAMDEDPEDTLVAIPAIRKQVHPAPVEPGDTAAEISPAEQPQQESTAQEEEPASMMPVDSSAGEVAAALDEPAAAAPELAEEMNEPASSDDPRFAIADEPTIAMPELAALFPEIPETDAIITEPPGMEEAAAEPPEIAAPVAGVDEPEKGVIVAEMPEMPEIDVSAEETPEITETDAPAEEEPELSEVDALAEEAPEPAEADVIAEEAPAPPDHIMNGDASEETTTKDTADAFLSVGKPPGRQRQVRPRKKNRRNS